MKKERDEYVDIAKGIGILLIICIHTEVFQVIGMPITFISVPVFFFMSGFYDRSERSFKQLVPKNFRTLILPAIIWVAISTLYIKILGYVKEGSWGDFPFTWYNIAGGNGPAWFLFALFYTKLFLSCIVRLKLPKVVYGGAILLIGYLGMHIDLPLFLDEGLIALPIYALGKLLYPYLRDLLTGKWLILAGMIAFVVYLSQWASFVIVPSGSCYKPYYLIALLIIMLNFFPFLWLSKKLVKIKFLSELGKHSLGIMLLHSPMCHTSAVILNRIFQKGSLSWIVCFLIMYVIIAVLSYLCCVLIEQKFPILLGKMKNEDSK